MKNNYWRCQSSHKKKYLLERDIAQPMFFFAHGAYTVQIFLMLCSSALARVLGAVLVLMLIGVALFAGVFVAVTITVLDILGMAFTFAVQLRSARPSSRVDVGVRSAQSITGTRKRDEWRRY